MDNKIFIENPGFKTRKSLDMPKITCGLKEDNRIRKLSMELSERYVESGVDYGINGVGYNDIEVVIYFENRKAFREYKKELKEQQNKIKGIPVSVVFFGKTVL